MVDSPTDDTTAKGVEATRKRSARLPFASRNSVMVYYVRSAQPTRSTTRYQYVAGSATSYEVRLRAWNCTCAAFTFSVLSGLGRGGQEREDAEGNGWEESKSWFGGLLMDQNGIPICKHLLACILVERSEALAGYVEEKIVNQEEAAGWGAGWGG
ncbi:hypothetical protein MMC13_006022 [Lambiella insularis]|nr:hypothetical protein [Lambiella insularis]